MISFRKGYQPEEYFKLTKADIKKLADAIVGKDPLYEGSYHSGLNPIHITEIIKHLMYVEKNKSIQIIIDKELDGFHLAITIDKKDK